MWQEIVTTIILSVVGAIGSGIGALVIKWLSSKIKSEKAAHLLNEAYQVVHEGVTYVYQTYVEGLKGTSLWNEEAMKNASQQAATYIQKNLPKNVVEFLEANGKTLEDWIAEQIEIAVQQQK